MRFLVFVFLTASLLAQQRRHAKVSLEVEPLFGSRSTSYPCFLVKMGNRTPNLLTGRLRVTLKGWVWEKSVALKPEATSVCRVYLQFKLDHWETCSVKFHLDVGVGAERFTARANANWNLYTTSNCVVLGMEAGHLDFLRDTSISGLDTYYRVIGVDEADLLPDRWFGWCGVDVVVLRDVNFYEWSEAQRNALVDWVRLGGHVVLIPSGDPNWFKQRTLRQLIPVEKVKSESIAPQSLGSLKRLVTAARGGGKLSFFIPEVRGGATTVLGTRQHPVILGYPSDNPRVFLFCVDETSLLYRSHSRPVLWKTIFSRIASAGKVGNIAFTDLATPSAPLSRSLIGLPSFWAVLALLLLYIAAVGPVNFVILRRMKREILLPLTIAGVSAFFVAVTFAYGLWTRGITSRVRRVSLVVWKGGEEDSLLCELIALRSGFPRTVSVRAPAECLIIPVQAPKFVHFRCEAGETVLSMPLGMWEAVVVAVIAPAESPGSLFLDRTGSTVNLTNTTSYPLLGAVAVDNRTSRVAQFGPLPIGKQGKCSWSRQNYYWTDEMGSRLFAGSVGYTSLLSLGASLYDLLGRNGAGSPPTVWVAAHSKKFSPLAKTDPQPAEPPSTILLQVGTGEVR